MRDAGRSNGNIEIKKEFKPVPFEEAITLTGLGRFHLLLLLGCALCLVSMMVSSLNTSYLLPSASCDLHMTSKDKGLLSAISYVGMICSSHMWGFLADTRGRKRVLIVGLLADSVCSAAASFVPNFWLYLIFRFFNGFFICSSSNVVYAYMGEFHSNKNRTWAIMALGGFVSVGSIVLTGIAWLVIPQPWRLELTPLLSYSSWRVFVLLCSVPSAVTALYLARVLPESPKILLVQGREEEALRILRRVYSLNSGHPSDQYKVRWVVLDSSEVRAAPVTGGRNTPSVVLRSVWRQTAPLFLPPHLKNTAIACLMQFAFYSTSIGLVQWLPNMFNDIAEYYSRHSEPPSDICAAIGSVSDAVATNSSTSFAVLGSLRDVLGAVVANSSTSFAVLGSLSDVLGSVVANSSTEVTCLATVSWDMFKNSMIHGSASGVFYVLGGLLINLAGKKNLLYAEVLLATGCGLGLYFVVTTTWVLVLSCLFVALLFSCIGILNCIVVDIFPTHLRAMALSLSLMMGRLGAVVGNLLIGSLLDYNCSCVFFVLSALVLAAGALCWFLPPPEKTTLA